MVQEITLHKIHVLRPFFSAYCYRYKLFKNRTIRKLISNSFWHNLVLQNLPIILNVMIHFNFDSGKRGNVEMTSSGAFFDPRSISKKSMDGLTDPRLNLPANIGGAQSDIIAQLTREMKLQQGSTISSLEAQMPTFHLHLPD